MRHVPFHVPILALLLLLAACSDAPAGGGDPGPDPDPGDEASTEPLELAGTWRLTYDSADPSDPATRILEFGTATSGEADDLRHDARSNVVRCGTSEYALLADGGLLLAGVPYDVERRSEDDLGLTYAYDGGSVEATLERLDELPFERCTEVAASSFANLYTSVHSNSKLNMSPAGDLVLTLDTNDDAIARVATGTGRIVQEYPEPQYSVVVAIADLDRVVGGCHCGGRRVAETYDLTSADPGAPLDRRDDLQLEDGTAVRLNAGIYDARAREVVLAVREIDAPRNHLMRLTDDGSGGWTTQGFRPVLEGASILDLAVIDGDLHALVGGGSLVRIDDDGRAAESFAITGTPGPVRGVTGFGGGASIYVLSEWNERGYIHLATLP